MDDLVSDVTLRFWLGKAMQKHQSWQSSTCFCKQFHPHWLQQRCVFFLQTHAANSARSSFLALFAVPLLHLVLLIVILCLCTASLSVWHEATTETQQTQLQFSLVHSNEHQCHSNHHQSLPPLNCGRTLFDHLSPSDVKKASAVELTWLCQFTVPVLRSIWKSSCWTGLCWHWWEASGWSNDVFIPTGAASGATVSTCLHRWPTLGSSNFKFKQLATKHLQSRSIKQKAKLSAAPSLSWDALALMNHLNWQQVLQWTSCCHRLCHTKKSGHHKQCCKHPHHVMASSTPMTLDCHDSAHSFLICCLKLVFLLRGLTSFSCSTPETPQAALYVSRLSQAFNQLQDTAAAPHWSSVLPSHANKKLILADAPKMSKCNHLHSVFIEHFNMIIKKKPLPLLQCHIGQFCIWLIAPELQEVDVPVQPKLGAGLQFWSWSSKGLPSF